MFMRTAQSRVFALAAAGACALSPSFANAGGFQINEHAAKATGRASSVTATVDDPSAIFHNAAGLTQTEGTEIMIGLSLIRPRGGFTADGGTETQETIQSFVPVPYAYVSRALSSKAFVGFGFYAPYGLGIKWDDPDNQSAFIGRTVISELSLRTYFLTPAIALKLSDMFSVAVSVSLVPATVYLRRTLGATDNGQVLFPSERYGSEGKIELAASAFGVGANFGFQLTFIDHLKIGFNFRSAVDLAFSGKADFQIPEGVPADIAARFPDQDGDAELTLPHSFALGIGWVDGPLSLEAGAQLTLWQSYDELRINFSSGLPTPSSASRRDWKPRPLLRAGGAYDITQEATVRLGFGYDITPVPDDTIDPTLPDANRIIFTVGGGYDFGPVRADIGYMGLILGSRRSDASENFRIPGEYPGGLVHVISVSAGVEL